MEKLDQTYLNNLVDRSRQGNSNAFAELFSAVFKRHWAYLSYMYDSVDSLESALKDVQAKILKSISGLTRPVLYMPWSCRIIFRLWREAEGGNDDEVAVTTPAGNFSLSQLYMQPVTESQVVIMHYYQHISLKEIADILNFDKALVKQALRSALKHLKHADANTDIPEGNLETGEQARPLIRESYDEALPARLLEEVFDECGRKPNTVPLEALSAYAVYRKERFSLQRAILIVAIVLFLLLPFLFITPEFNVSSEAKGDRGLPVYTIKVSSLLPTGKVNARLNSRTLPVYDAGSSEYTVEPTRNGKLKIEVALFNSQSVSREYEVTEVDSKGPVLLGNEINDDKVVLLVGDEGIGVDFRKIYALDSSGDTHYPLDTYPENGKVIFEYPKEVWDVYVPDYIGNMLHLTFTFE